MSGKDGAKNEPASWDNFLDMMGDLMMACVPPKDARAIKAGFGEMATVLLSAVENSHEIPDKVGKPIYEWVRVDGKKVPDNALRAAKDFGNDVYVGRGILDGSVRLGKYHAENERLFVSNPGEDKEISENILVLCVDRDAMVEWAKIGKSIWRVFRKIHRGDRKTKGMMRDLLSALIPTKDVEAIKAGFKEMSTVLGSVVEGATKVRKNEPASLRNFLDMMGDLLMAFVSPKDAQAIKAGFKKMGRVLVSAVESSHEIPDKVGKPIYEWVCVDGKKVPDNALRAAKDFGNDVYVGRGTLDGSVRLGKYHAKNERLFVSNLGEDKEISENILVLCVDKDAMVEWAKIAKSIWKVIRKIHRGDRNTDRKTKGMMRDLLTALIPTKDVEAIKAGVEEMSTVLGSVVEGATKVRKSINE